MSMEISKESREQLTHSIQRYFKENMDEPIGNMTAAALMDFFVEELGPLIYNKAVADVQERLQARIMEVDLEVYENEFQYWSRFDKGRK